MKKLFICILLTMVFQWANAIEITIRNIDGSTEVRHFDVNTERIRFIYGDGRNMVEIVGLEQLVNLKEIWIGMTPFINDFSFLTRLDNIEALVFQDIRFSDIDFIYTIPSLKRLIFQSCRINNVIDATRLPYLEYFEFTHSQLTEFPILIQERRNIDTINVAFNNISNIPIDESLDILIIAVRNQIRNTGNSNIVTDVPGNNIFIILPEKYRQYLR